MFNHYHNYITDAVTEIQNREFAPENIAKKCWDLSCIFLFALQYVLFTSDTYRWEYFKECSKWLNGLKEMNIIVVFIHFLSLNIGKMLYLYLIYKFPWRLTLVLDIQGRVELLKLYEIDSCTYFPLVLLCLYLLQVIIDKTVRIKTSFRYLKVYNT